MRADLEGLDAVLGGFRLDRDQPLVVVCHSGRRSALAAGVAAGNRFKQVYNLEGGMLAWTALGYPVATGQALAPQAAPAGERLVPMSTGRQLASLVSGLGFKPTYMLLTLLLILFLARAQSRDMKLIRWGLVSFLVGESFCALNYLCSGGASYWLDMLHGLGMVGMGMLTSWGLFVMLDQRTLGLSDPKAGCSLRRLCGRCWKQEEVSCLLQRVMLFLAPAFAVVSLMPWTAPLRSSHSLSMVFGTPVAFGYPIDLQLADFRVYPLIAAVLLLAALVLLLGGGHSLRRAQLPLFGGIGFMSFSLFRFFLLEAYRTAPVWADFWEETTELLFILGLGLFLFFYRRRLGLTREEAS